MNQVAWFLKTVFFDNFHITLTLNVINFIISTLSLGKIDDEIFYDQVAHMLYSLVLFLIHFIYVVHVWNTNPEALTNAHYFLADLGMIDLGINIKRKHAQ